MSAGAAVKMALALVLLGAAPACQRRAPPPPASVKPVQTQAQVQPQAPAQTGAPAQARDLTRWPFSADSPWNTPLQEGTRFEAAGGHCTRGVTDPRLTAWINAASWSHPVYRARATDPLVGIYLQGEATPRARVHAPKEARPALPQGPESDAHLHIIDPTGHHVDEMWRARPRADGGWEAEGYTRTDLSGPGVGQGGERAYGGSALGGLIRQGELQAGIRHALAFALPRSHLRRGPVWPASAEDDGAQGTYLGQVPMGQLVAIPKEVDLGALGLRPASLAVARALQDFGAYLADAAGDFTLYAEPAMEAEVDPVRKDLVRLRSLLRCVLNDDRAGGRPGQRSGRTR